MKLNDIWGYGQLFGYSGLDGKNRCENDFIGTLTAEKIGIRFELQKWIKLFFPLQGEIAFSAITGDMIDSRNTDVEIALAFAAEAVRIAPCYYVTGNHEVRVPGEYRQLKAGMEAAGVIVLENAKTQICLEGQAITVIGVDDPSHETEYPVGNSAGVIRKHLDMLQSDGDGFTLLLSHRPELFETYVDCGIDLTLSGHTHGGQIRLPFIGGLVANDKTLFPWYHHSEITIDLCDTIKEKRRRNAHENRSG